MKKRDLILNESEKIVFKVSNVRQGFWGAYTNNLIITNQCVIIEKYGLMNNYKGIERIYYNNIKQAIKGKAFNDENQLEIYKNDGKIETFATQSGNGRELKVLLLAINDQMSSDAKYYDYSFYQRMLKPVAKSVEILETRPKVENEKNSNNSSESSFLKKSAENILKSKKITPKGIVKGLIKAGGESSSLKKAKDNVLNDLGIYDIQDTFIDIGNDFRDIVGLKPKMTNEERLKIEKKKQQNNKPRKKTINYSFEEQLEMERNEIKSPVKENNNNLIDSQIEILKKLKELLDEGILTEEEFESKKKDILNS